MTHDSPRLRPRRVFVVLILVTIARAAGCSPIEGCAADDFPLVTLITPSTVEFSAFGRLIAPMAVHHRRGQPRY